MGNPQALTVHRTLRSLRPRRHRRRRRRRRPFFLDDYAFSSLFQMLLRYWSCGESIVAGFHPISVT